MRKRRPCIGLCHLNRVAKAKVRIVAIFNSGRLSIVMVMAAKSMPSGRNNVDHLLCDPSCFAGFARPFVEAPEAGGQGEEGEGENGKEGERDIGEGGERESFEFCGDWKSSYHGLQQLKYLKTRTHLPSNSLSDYQSC